MGWLVMYVSVFMLMAAAMVNHQVERRDQYDDDQAAAKASQMTVWHKAAFTTCREDSTKCPTGRVAEVYIKENLGKLNGYKGTLFGSSVFQDPQLYSSGDFVSLADVDDRLVVTYFVNRQTSGQFAGRIVAQLTVGAGWSASTGFYDAASHKVDRVRMLAEDNPLTIRGTVPPSISAQIPDNAPMIMTRY
jgi:hypothetical protein